MKNYIVYQTNSGKIVKTGCCPDHDFESQKRGPGETIIEGTASDLIQKVVDGKVVKKTPAEIEAEKPPAIPDGDRPAEITNADWQKIKDRIAELESK